MHGYYLPEWMQLIGWAKLNDNRDDATVWSGDRGGLGYLCREFSPNAFHSKSLIGTSTDYDTQTNMESFRNYISNAGFASSYSSNNRWSQRVLMSCSFWAEWGSDAQLSWLGFTLQGDGTCWMQGSKVYKSPFGQEDWPGYDPSGVFTYQPSSIGDDGVYDSLLNKSFQVSLDSGSQHKFEIVVTAGLTANASGHAFKGSGNAPSHWYYDIDGDLSYLKESFAHVYIDGVYKFSCQYSYYGQRNRSSTTPLANGLMQPIQPYFNPRWANVFNTPGPATDWSATTGEGRIWSYLCRVHNYDINGPSAGQDPWLTTDDFDTPTGQPSYYNCPVINDTDPITWDCTVEVGTGSGLTRSNAPSQATIAAADGWPTRDASAIRAFVSNATSGTTTVFISPIDYQCWISESFIEMKVWPWVEVTVEITWERLPPYSGTGTFRRKYYGIMDSFVATETDFTALEAISHDPRSSFENSILVGMGISNQAIGTFTYGI